MPIAANIAELKRLVEANLPEELPPHILDQVARFTERFSGEAADFMLVSSQFLTIDGTPLPLEMIVIKDRNWYELEIQQNGSARLSFVDLRQVADTWLGIGEQGDTQFNMYLVSERSWNGRTGGEAASDLVALAEHVTAVMAGRG